MRTIRERLAARRYWRRVKEARSLAGMDEAWCGDAYAGRPHEHDEGACPTCGHRPYIREDWVR